MFKVTLPFGGKESNKTLGTADSLWRTHTLILGMSYLPTTSSSLSPVLNIYAF